MPAMFSLRFIFTLVVAVFALHLPAAERGVRITEHPGKLRVELNGELFTEYVFEGAPHVYFYPVIGPGGAPMTRSWPMKEAEGEERDHKHHRSLWFSHGAVNGVDFWAETERSGKIVHDKFLEVKGGPDSGVIRSTCNWVAPDGKVVCTDERTFRVYNRPGTERLFDFEVTLKAGEKEVILGDTKEGTMSMRLNESMRLTKMKQPGEKQAQKGEGRIVNSEGVRDNDTWGKRAKWCDYHGPVNGKVVGAAIFDHPQNPRHPTWWHVRYYGLFGANPFGIHDFTYKKEPAGAGNLVIAPGRSVTFRYRFYLHEGDEKQARVAERYDEYATGRAK
jgi:hypothetical protein